MRLAFAPPWNRGGDELPPESEPHSICGTRSTPTVPPKILSGTPESQAMARTSPQSAAGLTQGGSPIHFTPAGGFDNSEKWYGGGRLEVSRHVASFPVFHSFVAEGRGSSTMREMSLALEGSA